MIRRKTYSILRKPRPNNTLIHNHDNATFQPIMIPSHNSCNYSSSTGGGTEEALSMERWKWRLPPPQSKNERRRQRICEDSHHPRENCFIHGEKLSVTQSNPSDINCISDPTFLNPSIDSHILHNSKLNKTDSVDINSTDSTNFEGRNLPFRRLTPEIPKNSRVPQNVARLLLMSCIAFMSLLTVEGTFPYFMEATKMSALKLPHETDLDTIVYRLRASDADRDYPITFDIKGDYNG